MLMLLIVNGDAAYADNVLNGLLVKKSSVITVSPSL